jgi:hypothetical protein
MAATYAHVFKRGRQFGARVIERNGQFIDGYAADTAREIAHWLAEYYPEAKIAPAPSLAGEFRQKEKDNAR